MISVNKAESIKKNKIDQLTLWLSRYWLFGFVILFGVFVLTPFLAPVLMALGLTAPAKGIYWFYSFFCHQLPQRSYFLFGPKISYSISEIGLVWPGTDNMLSLRKFVGVPSMGWKVAWSDRMVSMYTSIWVFAILWGGIKNRIKTLPLWGLLLLILPMAIDGTSHMISDFAGIGLGFRDSNQWLVNISNHRFAFTFYAGDSWGSFNAWMRLISGVLFGLGMVWLGFPYLNESFLYSAEIVKLKIQNQITFGTEKQNLTYRLNRDYKSNNEGESQFNSRTGGEYGG
jgi:uncharacterized membrane protein